MKKVLKVLGILVGAVVLLVGAGIAWLALRSPASRPPSTEKFEATPARLARGKYLVHNLADCVGCHSDHDWDKFGMPLKPGTLLQGGFTFTSDLGIPGEVSAQNLTPDPETGKGNWTDGEIMRAFREGVSKDGHALFPMMPYQAYRKMSDEDAKSIVVYLRTIPPIRKVIPPSKIAFPVNLLIKFEPKPIDGVVEMPDDAKDHMKYAEYVTNLAGCQDCHTSQDDKGKKNGPPFAGGWEFRGPWGRVVSANITPDPETSYMGTATKEQFISRFKSMASLASPDAPKLPKGNSTVMPWIAFSGLTDQDLGAIYDYLKAQPPVKKKIVTMPDAVAAK